MKKLVLFVCSIALAGPDRASLLAIEKMMDRRIETLFDDPFLLLGMTRGVYLEGTGAVFSAEVGLVVTPAGPFAAKASPEESAARRKKRLERLPALKSAIQEMMERAAPMLEKMPSGEQIVLGVTIFRRSGEDNAGIPAQIVARATRADLLAKKPAALKEY